MSEHGKDGLMPCLFSEQGMVLDNIKFFRGESKVISESDFRKALCDAEARKKSGEVSALNHPPSSGAKGIDVREWVDSI